MRKFVIACLVLVLSASVVTAKSGMALSPSLVKGRTVLDIANKAQMIELNDLLGKPQANVRLRLFEIPEEGTCVPETHAVCSNRYYVGVIEVGEVPAQALFSLGRVGEISDITWLETKIEGAVLEFTVTNYPKSALQANPELKGESKRYRATIEMEIVGKPPFTYKLRVAE